MGLGRAEDVCVLGELNCANSDIEHRKALLTRR